MPNSITDAQRLETENRLNEAVQAYENILKMPGETAILARANFKLGMIYRTWGELFVAHRFLAKAHQLSPSDPAIRNATAELNLYFSENREAVADQMSRQNSDQIVSLFRIATGIKLISMDKSVQAYPLLKSRTKIFPNAAVAKHLLTDIQITEEERNSAIAFLLEKDWLVSTGVSLYTITERGLYVFYSELAQLHVDNGAYTEALLCYEQALWLDPSQEQLRCQQLVCYTEAEAWEEAVEILARLPAEVPDVVAPETYYTAVARSYHHAYQTTQDEDIKQKVVEACENVLRLNKKARAISKLLASYQAKKPWWHR